MRLGLITMFGGLAGITLGGYLVDHLGPRDQVFQFAHPAFIVALGFLGGVIFGIFRKVAMGARFRNRFDDPRTLFLLAPAKLLVQLGKTTLRHRNFFYHFYRP